MFISDKFIFNGIHCDDKNISLITMNSDIVNKYGMDYRQNIVLTNNSNSPSYCIAENTEVEDVVLLMCLNDEYGVPMEWDNETLLDIYDWLITDKFCEFVSEDDEDVSYYFKAVGISKQFTKEKTGYIEVTFKPMSSCAYKKYTKKISVSGETMIPILNSSNLSSVYYPVVEIKNTGDVSNIIGISNISLNNEEFTITGLSNGSTVIVDNLIGSAFDSDGVNMLMNCNRKWIGFKRGKNILNIRGNCELVIKCQLPVGM